MKKIQINKINMRKIEVKPEEFYNVADQFTMKTERQHNRKWFRFG